MNMPDLSTMPLALAFGQSTKIKVGLLRFNMRSANSTFASALARDAGPRGRHCAVPGPLPKRFQANMPLSHTPRTPYPYAGA